jgi:hypothetical protein
MKERGRTDFSTPSASMPSSTITLDRTDHVGQLVMRRLVRGNRPMRAGKVPPPFQSPPDLNGRGT